MDGKDEHQELGIAVLDVADQLQAATAFERQVDDGQVGLALGDGLKGLGGGPSLRADGQVGLPVDVLGQPLAHDGVVVDDQDPRLSLLGCHVRAAFLPPLPEPNRRPSRRRPAPGPLPGRRRSTGPGSA